ncbi:hypothetical protein A3I95_03450 [Candidatus Nomurabacteria bacterium RIFCSPLOWO2_02_FULL_44_12]|uniref:ATP-grasp domain-containing protein n=1 Tax=Candidatus Nomurabacteria bacterium RIFCSPLOWO2_12_FULL_44_11 TaxID=1801796 RepID=A0A1F6Y728_9BACT|nr:MAG: hypothetical protein A3G53_02160 [Candidatus Nomurabacteria bacterium RIFCSPLOWO2_12_FULL_44_11]OGJ07651.1 MAG: hypothetical protein A3I95_03450 [Candidatus Nomurabacteria bacterium RIFCSPLOWO2_02_FULL_44_12]
MKPKIGIYIPRWFQGSSKSDKMFADELFKTIKNSDHYSPLLLNLSNLSLSSKKDAVEFCRHQNLVLITHHDSPFFSANLKYKKNVKLLESYIPFVNSTKSQEIGYNKITTKNILRKKGLPVLDNKIINSLLDLENNLEEGKYYVVKPPDKGAGTGVKLVKKENANHFAYHDGKWRKVKISAKKLKDGKNAITLKYNFNFFKSPLLFLQKINIDFSYDSMLVEPYFNDDKEGFSSLRCTVIGDEVVEAVKRTNYRNITSNVSSGGTAEKTELTDYQKEIAVAAKNAIGADYAGVDFLVSENKTVIGEVNIGPFTLWHEHSGVNVGKIFGEYLMKKCDEMRR